MSERKKELEIYIHIPFCVKKCKYCDFLSGPGDEDTKAQYIEALCCEIQEKSNRYRQYEVTSIFFGGGTPTAVEAKMLCRVLAVVKERFDVKTDAEITIEMNPGTVKKEALILYKKAGVNRVSLGLQSIHNEELQRLGRIHTYEQFLETYEQVRAVGFENVNIDLMSALPGQDMESYKKSLERVTQLIPPPEHISAYSLIIEEGTPFYEKYEQGKLDLPVEEVEREMYHLTKVYLKEQGYERYEISNYAKPDRECVHNIGYWQRKNYVGFGIGAASLIENERFSNGEDLQEYLENPCDCEINHQCLSVEEQMEEYMFLGLRMCQGVSIKGFYQSFGSTLNQVYGQVMEKHIKNGLLEQKEGWIRLTEAGMDVSNYVMADFLEPDI
ncbi:MAG: oxygen-independent coproporphyrinogen III oxidase [Lachnospiraceae bacterium]|nr:oxygen-independent coproporphyrinogen III oxidase [Lachnospiraceae bacterium]